MQNLFECPNCRTRNQIGYRSCKKCGLVFQYSCPKCKYPVNGGDAACSRCGSSLEWPSVKENLTSSTNKAEDKPIKEHKVSWGGLLVGLLIIVLLGGIGSYIFLNLSGNYSTQVITENQTINQLTGKEEKENGEVAKMKDAVAPVILNIQVNNLSSNSVEICWETDELSTSQVIWNAENGSSNSTLPKEAMVNRHSIELTGLINPMTYYYQVASIDQYGNEALSAQQAFSLGKQMGIAAIEVMMTSMVIEEKPPISGLRTYVRGRIKNTGDITVDIQNIEVTVKVTVAGSAGGEITAILDPYPAKINPGETHKFYAIVPNNANPEYLVSAKVLSH